MVSPEDLEKLRGLKTSNEVANIRDLLNLGEYQKALGELQSLSGEVLAGDKGFGIDPTKAVYLANEVKSIHEIGVEIGLVIGAGYIFDVEYNIHRNFPEK